MTAGKTSQLKKIIKESLKKHFGLGGIEATS
jgi:hypothetical protein